MHAGQVLGGGKLERRGKGVPVAALVGMDVARRLAAGGWRSVRQFLLAESGEVALRTRLPEAQVRRLQEAGGLRRVHGLGPRGVECLAGVGVVSAALLAASDPLDLHARLVDRSGPEAPPEPVVRGWVVAARARGGA